MPLDYARSLSRQDTHTPLVLTSQPHSEPHSVCTVPEGQPPLTQASARIGARVGSAEEVLDGNRYIGKQRRGDGLSAGIGHDLRGLFQWASDNNLAVLAATRPHIELFRHHMEQRGLAASTSV